MGRHSTSFEPSREPALVAATRWQLRSQLTLYGCEIIENLQESGFLTINQDKKTVNCRGQAVHLTPAEFKILCLLTGKRGICLTYREVYDAVRGPGFHVGDGPNGHRNAARTHVKRIRNKLKEIDPAFDQIETRPGFGYLWRSTSALEAA